MFSVRAMSLKDSRRYSGSVCHFAPRSSPMRAENQSGEKLACTFTGEGSAWLRFHTRELAKGM